MLMSLSDTSQQGVSKLIARVFFFYVPSYYDYIVSTSCRYFSWWKQHWAETEFTLSYSASVHWPVSCNKQTNPLVFLCRFFPEKRLNLPHSHFHRAQYLTVGMVRNKQRQGAAFADLSNLKFINYIKPRPGPSGNICNPKLCLPLLPPASSCHKHSI